MATVAYVDSVSDTRKQYISTGATSGMILTPNFKENISIGSFNLAQEYSVRIFTPFYRVNVSDEGFDIIDKIYDINIEYDIENKFECVQLDVDTAECLNKNQTTHKTNLEKTVGFKTYNIGSKMIKFTRNFQTKKEIRKWEKPRMTGFKVQWSCRNCNDTTDLQVSRLYRTDTKNIYFVKLANIL